MKRMRLASLALIIVAATSCGSVENREESSQSRTETCKEIVEWVDFLMINNVKYSYNYDGTKEVTEEQLGEKVGEVSYMLNEHACSGHVSKNGDAAYLPVGTEIYALKGYKPEFRVAAGNKIYQAGDNPNAATMKDLLDIDGKVDKVSLVSGMDGSLLGDFSAEASSAFIRELLPLPYEGFDAIYEKTKHESGIFLRIHLKDGTSFRMVYYAKGNGFTAGAFGTDRLQELILSERQRIKSAVAG
ncbi:hypothetical protein [Paenibacillus mendelii]|uniref:Lipoprotein n=1 Tax=Paenibacillus mendelii TaxID=206163 RepID=A0ABV6JAX9_9BACL|nr:hypothetical protein [Paenibacillus mendelii]MCQ6563762.1 hypothetical protein [Paenibacillus mendelii]